VPNSLKILGQQAAVGGTQKTLYTVPAGASAVVSSVVMCNQGTTAPSPTVTVTHGSTTTHIFNSPTALASNATISLVLGITLGAGDSIKVSDAGASASTDFTAFGVEIT
jgi:hypothetical protein